MPHNEAKVELLNCLEQKAGDYQELYASCAQGTLLALQEQFDLGETARPLKLPQPCPASPCAAKPAAR